VCGLTARFYNNDSFSGSFKQQKIHDLDFNWTGGAPCLEINNDNFSVLISGFISIPIDSTYYFIVRTNDAVKIMINNSEVLNHNMMPSKGDFEDTDEWLNNAVFSNSSQRFESKKIFLRNGEKYKIDIFYSYSNTRTPNDLEKVFLNVKWRNELTMESKIPCRLLYLDNSTPTISISNFDVCSFGVKACGDGLVLRRLLENDLAFKNSERFIIKDIPREYINLNSIKLNSLTRCSKISFEVNAPIEVFIARIAVFPKPFEDDWENTGLRMSLIELPEAQYGRMKINKSVVLKIYKKAFQSGKVNIRLNYIGNNLPGTALIIFYRLDMSNPLSKSPLSCSGGELWISDPKSKFFEECVTSSSFPGTNCKDGLNGSMDNKPSNTWSSQAEGKDAYMKVSFDSFYLITRLEYKDKKNPLERNSSIKVYLSNGYSQIFHLENTDETVELKFDSPRKANSMTIKIKDTFGTMNNGFSVKVFGYKCISINILSNTSTDISFMFGSKASNLPTLFNFSQKNTLHLDCGDSISNNNNFEDLMHLSQIEIFCASICKYSLVPVYGTDYYSKDSALCKAAYHSGVLLKGGTKIIALIQKSSTKQFNGSYRKGIQSKSKSWSPLSISFRRYQKQDRIVMALGVKVDYYDEISGIWLPGLIKEIHDVPEQEGKVFYLSISIIGKESLTYEKVFYPDSSKVQPCGEHILNRSCEFSTTHDTDKKVIRIKFAPANAVIKKTDAFIDSGKVFGSDNNPFGWSEDMTERVVVRVSNKATSNNNENYNLSSLVEFPISPKSAICKESSVITSKPLFCKEVTYIFKSGQGNFEVKLHVGDPLNETRADFRVNNVTFARNKYIGQGDYEVLTKDVSSHGDYLTVYSECMDNCDFQMSRLNMIEISKISDDPDLKELPRSLNNKNILNSLSNLPESLVDEYVNESCSNSYDGKRCLTGPEVVNCIYSDLMNPAAMMCSGKKALVRFPDNFHCINLRKKFKCVLKEYSSQSECLVFCPVDCDKGVCFG